MCPSYKVTFACSLIGATELRIGESHTNSAVLDEGKAGSITCVFVGNPIQITWSKVGVKQLPARRVIPSGETLSFTNVRKEDAGEYICSAFDGFSTETASVNVTIDGKR